jgi:hypothetical protein
MQTAACPHTHYAGSHLNTAVKPGGTTTLVMKRILIRNVSVVLLAVRALHEGYRGFTSLPAASSRPVCCL